MDIFPPAKQRPAMLALVSALDCQEKDLRRDECGDWRIRGSQGHIYADVDGYLIIVETETPRQWSATKDRLAFAQLRNDRDWEGSFFLDRLPTPAEGPQIRRALMLRKRVRYSEEYAQTLRERLGKRAVAA